MAKDKRKKGSGFHLVEDAAGAAPPPVAEVPDPPPVAEVPAGPPAFPRLAPCPRCGAPSKAYATKEDRQYRRCTSAVCRWPFVQQSR